MECCVSRYLDTTRYLYTACTLHRFQSFIQHAFTELLWSDWCGWKMWSLSSRPSSFEALKERWQREGWRVESRNNQVLSAVRGKVSTTGVIALPVHLQLSEFLLLSHFSLCCPLSLLFSDYSFPCQPFCSPKTIYFNCSLEELKILCWEPSYFPRKVL